MIPGRMLAQLGWVAERDTERMLPDPYAWPPSAKGPPTEEEMAESERLRAIADDCFRRAAEAGFEETGTDAVFGGES